MCFFSVWKKSEVFIYRWYIPSASLEVGSYAQLLQYRSVSVCSWSPFPYFGVYSNLSEVMVGEIVKFWHSDIVMPNAWNRSLAESKWSHFRERIGRSLLQYWKVILYRWFVNTSGNLVILRIYCMMTTYIYAEIIFSFLLVCKNISKWFIMSYQINFFSF